MRRLSSRRINVGEDQNRFDPAAQFGRTAYFDVEANGLAELNRSAPSKPLQPEITTVWCGVIIDQDGEVFRYGPDEIERFVYDLMGYDCLIGHNIIEYDFRVLRRLYPHLTFGEPPVLIDTLVTARMLWPDRDLCPFVNRHSLKAWGQFLDGEGKIDYQGGFDRYHPDMLDYCVQDVVVTKRLWEFLWKHVRGYEEPLEREHRRAERLAAMTERGVGFDLPAAYELRYEIDQEQAAVSERLQAAFPPRIETMRTPAYYVAGGKRYDTIGEAKLDGHARDQIEAGPLRTKEHPFDPNSRQQIAKRLGKKYGWVAQDRTEKGAARVDEAVLRSLPYEEAGWCADYLVLQKRMSQLQDWIERAEQSRDGRIHATVRPTGAVSGRCTSSQPNLQQVTSARQRYGDRMRALFVAGDDNVLIGCDAAQLELRILAHYLADYDDGEYIRIVTEADAHQANADAFGVDRNTAKTAVFGLVYGAGDAKFGSIVGGGAKRGRELKEAYFKRFPQMRHLMEWCQTQARTRGHMRLLDGRDVPVRAEHSALNLLIQGSGQCVMTLAWEMIADLPFVLEVHDEAEVEVPRADAFIVADRMEQAIAEAGRRLGVKCPMVGEAKVGATWFDVH